MPARNASRTPPGGEVTDRMLIFGGRHRRLVMAEHEAHYNGRPHRSRQLYQPQHDQPLAGLFPERIKRPARPRRRIPAGWAA
jgi:hypothetical protein